MLWSPAGLSKGHRTGACYTNKLTYSHGSSIKIWVRSIQICVLYFYDRLHMAINDVAREWGYHV